MKKETEEKLALSLSAETTELLPFLPYLLQDLWELGSNWKDMAALLKKHMPISEKTKILDLACGKGAVSTNIAKNLNVRTDGYDLIPDFIEEAIKKAKEMQVDSLCHFKCGDAKEAVTLENDYDCVILGGSGNILGDTWQEALTKMIKTVKPLGYIMIDESYLSDNSSNEELKFEYDQLTHEQWLQLFIDNGLILLDEIQNAEEYDYDSDTKTIATRASELIIKHPEKRAMFEGYIQSQINQCIDLKDSVIAVTWLLQKT
jgi:ubiquinone/menaquinone biosynthesis C-methylase UbiE